MSTQALATTANSELAPINTELLSEYLTSMGLATKLNAGEKTQFLQIAQAYGLNPFKREIYATKYNDNFSIIVGYETYIKRAERSGKLDGWEAEFQGTGDELSCIVTIYRKDWSRPFRHEVWYCEAVQKTGQGVPTSFWKKPRQMTRKVAISQAFRLCFSDEIGGMPYTEDELPRVQDTTHEVVQAVATTAPVAAQPAPKKLTKLEQAELMKALENWHKALGAMLADPHRNFNPESYQIAATHLKSIANLPREEKTKTFWGLVSEAQNNNVEWDEVNRTFVLCEMVEEYELPANSDKQPSNEQLSQALADNG